MSNIWAEEYIRLLQKVEKELDPKDLVIAEMGKEIMRLRKGLRKADERLRKADECHAASLYRCDEVLKEINRLIKHTIDEHERGN
tara:strand:- start:500 stop:754 length:255 start_codon:yes stop_codon:yes gene_type:complete